MNQDTITIRLQQDTDQLHLDQPQLDQPSQPRRLQLINQRNQQHARRQPNVRSQRIHRTSTTLTSRTDQQPRLLEQPPLPPNQQQPPDQQPLPDQLHELPKHTQRDQQALQTQLEAEATLEFNLHQHDPPQHPIPTSSFLATLHLSSSFLSPSPWHQLAPVIISNRQVTVHHKVNSKLNGNNKCKAIKTHKSNGRLNISMRLDSFPFYLYPTAPPAITQIKFPVNICRRPIRVHNVINHQIATVER
jgi:hypothetical protein